MVLSPFWWAPVLLAIALLASLVLLPRDGAVACPQGRTLNIVAHPDDDLLFLSPDLLHDIQGGRCVRTVFLSAGDFNSGREYWEAREVGARAAYAQMSKVAEAWTQGDAGIRDHPLLVFTLTDRPGISLIFLRLPDGSMDGSGFPLNDYESLAKLWNESIPTLHSVDGSAQYTKRTLIETLEAIMTTYRPDQIRTQNFLGSIGDGTDHSDHYASAYFASAATHHYDRPHEFTGYRGYDISLQPANVFEPDLTEKQTAFLTYAQHDVSVCQTVSACAQQPYAAWWARQYPITASSAAVQRVQETVPSWRGGYGEAWRTSRGARLVDEPGGVGHLLQSPP